MTHNRCSTYCNRTSGRGRRAPLVVAAMVVVAAWGSMMTASLADESGVSFWLPGNFGSLAAVPGTPGWSFSAVPYYTSISAGSDVARARLERCCRKRRDATVLIGRFRRQYRDPERWRPL